MERCVAFWGSWFREKPGFKFACFTPGFSRNQLLALFVVNCRLIDAVCRRTPRHCDCPAAARWDKFHRTKVDSGIEAIAGIHWLDSDSCVASDNLDSSSEDRDIQDKHRQGMGSLAAVPCSVDQLGVDQ